MDNQMPTMSGTEATARLRAVGYAGAIIGMTGDPVGCPERAAFEQSGLDACVDKDSVGLAWVSQSLRELANAHERAARCVRRTLRAAAASKADGSTLTAPATAPLPLRSRSLGGTVDVHGGRASCPTAHALIHELRDIVRVRWTPSTARRYETDALGRGGELSSDAGDDDAASIHSNQSNRSHVSGRSNSANSNATNSEVDITPSGSGVLRSRLRVGGALRHGGGGCSKSIFNLEQGADTQRRSPEERSPTLSPHAAERM